jgi:uncharacterized protein
MLRLINQFVYRPEATFAERDFTPAKMGLAYEPVDLTTADGLKLSAWHFPVATPRCALLYCHGNAGNIRDWTAAMPPLLEMGCSVLLFDYRGYGLSQGQPSEDGLYLDGEAAWAWVRRQARQENVPAVILGKSLGTAVAIHTALQHPPHALILDSAFASMREIAMSVTPWLPDGMLPPLYESGQKVAGLTCPTLLIHGQEDTLVPIKHSQRLYDALSAPKTLRIIEGAGHNDVSSYPEYEEAIEAFLQFENRPAPRKS